MSLLQRGRTRLLWLVLAMLVGVLHPLAAQDEVSPGFEEWECPFPAMERVTCGYLVVPEDRSLADGATIELAVAIISAANGDPDAPAVVYLEGGPGGSALFGTDSFLTHPVTEDYTLILFDQRGTGFSVPSLNCPELEGEDGGDDPAACRDRLQDEGIDLQMYSTAASAADVNDLVLALGYEQVKLWGISYGTKLGLTVLRDFPEIVESAVLDSVYPPETDDYEVQTEAVLGALNTLFDSCAADSVCSEAYPTLEDDFYAMLEALDENPVTVGVAEDELTLDGRTVYDALFTTLYDTEALPFLPYGIDLLAHAQDVNDYAEGYDIVSNNALPVETGGESGSAMPVAESDEVLAYMDEVGQIDDAEGMAFSVDCQEEYQLHDAESAIPLAESAPAPVNTYLVDGIYSNVQNCEIWGVETADPIEGERVVSDVPTLLFAGAFDPITPISSAESALEGLSNGQLMAFPSAGHGITVADTESGACAKQLMLAFLADATAELDTQCIDETSVIEFYVP
ncbi:MAG: alpha/beta fold hydrolase [Anaerolineae bacterium]|nr:alpha/beta fold hydrolase [Anaerolineae bacterium]